MELHAAIVLCRYNARDSGFQSSNFEDGLHTFKNVSDELPASVFSNGKVSQVTN
jgi:hypothetical protein